MKDIIITTTHLKKEEQKEVKNLVKFMGGTYLNDLRDNVTHLVSNSVGTLKYETATQNNIKVMHVDWVRNF